MTDQAVRTGLRSGTLIRRCAGVYVPPDPNLSVAAEYLERVYARAGKSKVRVISHRSAAALDSGLRSGLSRTEVEVMAQRFGGFAGGATLRDAVRAADGLAANPGESLSRGLMLGFPEVPEPRLQHGFVDAAGDLIGFADFDWDGRVVGEFDGRHKYQKYLRPGESVEDAVIREKYREDRLRALGIHVMRWTWRDLMNPRRFRALLNSGLRLGGVL